MCSRHLRVEAFKNGTFAHRAGPVAGLLEANQSAPNCVQVRNLGVYLFCLRLDLMNDLGAELIRIEPQRKEFLNFNERETQFLSTFDKSQTPNSVDRVSPVSRYLSGRRQHEALALVVADRFEVHSAALGQLTNRECRRMLHNLTIQPVPNYGSTLILENCCYLTGASTWEFLTVDSSS